MARVRFDEACRASSNLDPKPLALNPRLTVITIIFICFASMLRVWSYCHDQHPHHGCLKVQLVMFSSLQLRFHGCSEVVLIIIGQQTSVLL